MKYYYFICTLLGVFVTTCSAQIAVIVNNSNHTVKIAPSSLKDIYLLSTLKWSDGTNIAVFDNREQSIHKKFFDFIGIRDIITVKKQWMRFQLSGEARAPEAVNGDDKMLSKVASTPGAVGYVKLSKIKNNDVKVIAKID